jgi:hypothetical protein
MKSLTANTRLRDRFRILRPLGKGGQSQVYLAADEANGGTTVVVKNMIYHSQDAKVRAEELELFLQESRILGEVQHPCLPMLVDAFADDDAHFVVEEYVGSVDLWALLRKRGGRLPLEEVAWLAHHLLDMLVHLHAQQPPVVLRDIKPSNVTCPVDAECRIDRRQRPWFIDLTIATRWFADREDAVKMGSPGYAPPEQYRGRSEPRSDLYALAATLLQALTAHDPVTTPFAIPPLASLRPDIPRGWDAFFRKALALDPRNRFRSAADMRAALEKLMPRSALGAMPPAVGAAPGETSRLAAAIGAPLSLDTSAVPGASQRWTVPAPQFRRRTVLSRMQMAMVLILCAALLVGLLAALGGLPLARGEPPRGRGSLAPWLEPRPPPAGAQRPARAEAIRRGTPLQNWS